MAQSNNSNRLVVPGAQNAIDQMKYEIANEFGVNLGPDTTARANGSVGGEITKRLSVERAYIFLIISLRNIVFVY